MKKESLFTDSVTALFITTYSYFLSITVQAGYYNYFNIPSHFIKTDAISISNIFFILMLIYTLFSFLDYKITEIFVHILQKYKNEDARNQQILYKNILTALLFSSIISIYFDYNKTIKTYLYTFTVLSALTIINIFFTHFQKNKTHSKENNYEKELIKSVEHIENNTLFKNLFGKQITDIIIFTSILIVPLSYNIGQKSASYQKIFYKINNNKNIAGIVFYENKIIALPIKNGKIDSTKTLILSINDSTLIEKKELSSFDPSSNKQPHTPTEKSLINILHIKIKNAFKCTENPTSSTP